MVDFFARCQHLSRNAKKQSKVIVLSLIQISIDLHIQFPVFFVSRKENPFKQKEI